MKMKSLKCKEVFVIFSMIILKGTWCGPVGKATGENSDMKSVFKRFAPNFFDYIIKHPTGESRYSNFIEPSQNYDYDYPSLEEHSEEKNGFKNSGNGDFIFPWFNLNNRDFLKFTSTTKKSAVEPLRKNNRHQKEFHHFRSDEDYESDDDDQDFDVVKNDGYFSNPSSYHPHFGNNHGFDHHHDFIHNHGFEHEHNPGCLFPFGDKKKRRPRPGPPGPPQGPPPPPGPPAATNPPTPASPITAAPTPAPPGTAAPTPAPPGTAAPTTGVSIDPRASTSGSIVSTDFPAIDIRFG